MCTVAVVKSAGPYKKGSSCSPLSPLPPPFPQGTFRFLLIKSSWLVLRSQVMDNSYDSLVVVGGNGATSEKAGLNMNVGDWCAGANEWDWDSGSGSGEAAQPGAMDEVSSGALASNGDENVRAEGVKASAPYSGTLSFTGPCLPSFYIDVFEETEGEERGNVLKPQGEGETDTPGDEEHDEKSSWSGEKYEKAVAKHGDKVFEKFHKVVSKWPEQILRYDYGRQPLFMRSAANPFKLECKNCGSPCVYEFQLMPALVYIIQKYVKEKLSSSGSDLPLIEFGTVIVYTCSKNCWDDSCPSFKEERCFVQFDPDEPLLNAFPPL